MFLKIYGEKIFKKDNSKQKKTINNENEFKKNISSIPVRRKTMNMTNKLPEKIKKTKTASSSIHFKGRNFAPKKLSKIRFDSDQSIDSSKKRNESLDIFSGKKVKKKYIRISSQEIKKPRNKKKKSFKLFHPYRKNPFPDIFLSDLIKDFFEPDFVKDYFCSFCRKKCTIKKSIYILQEPEILQISLKRFISHPRMMKIHRPIFIYKDKIDLNQYLFKPENFLVLDSSLYDSGVNSRRKINMEMTYNNSMSFNQSIAHRSTMYEMKAYVEHIGNLSKGHYVCFTKNDVIQSKIKIRNPDVEDEWFFIDDKKVYKVQDHSRKLLMYNPSVYSIFYKKIRKNL
jgi:hypothetical protein